LDIVKDLIAFFKDFQIIKLRAMSQNNIYGGIIGLIISSYSSCYQWVLMCLFHYIFP